MNPALQSLVGQYFFQIFERHFSQKNLKKAARSDALRSRSRTVRSELAVKDKRCY